VSQWRGRSGAPELRDGVDLLVGSRRADRARVLLAALLKAAGERAQVDYARELVFVRVEIDPRTWRGCRRTPRRWWRGAWPLLPAPLWVCHARSPWASCAAHARGLARGASSLSGRRLSAD